MSTNSFNQLIHQSTTMIKSICPLKASEMTYLIQNGSNRSDTAILNGIIQEGVSRIHSNTSILESELPSKLVKDNTVIQIDLKMLFTKNDFYQFVK